MLGEGWGGWFKGYVTVMVGTLVDSIFILSFNKFKIIHIHYKHIHYKHIHKHTYNTHTLQTHLPEYLHGYKDRNQIQWDV